MAKVRSLKIPCRFGSRQAPFVFKLGTPAPGFGSLHFQLEWLKERYGGEIAAPEPLNPDLPTPRSPPPEAPPRNGAATS
jgi:hypothetical protein